MSILYFNCASGISGDMVVGSLLDLGIETDYLTGELAKLDLQGYCVSARRIDKRGITATKFSVDIYAPQPHRNMAGIRRLIDASDLGAGVKRTAKDIFYNLASSEASVHNTDIDKVHFHEVGALDSIIDIVSTAILLDKLQVSETQSSTIPLGRGTVKTEHGVMGIPVPAVKHLLKGAPTKRTCVYAELTTPTGAAILKTCVKKYVDVSPRTDKKGYGAGTLDLKRPNVLVAGFLH
jgi:hypothetical protein